MWCVVLVAMEILWYSWGGKLILNDTWNGMCMRTISFLPAVMMGYLFSKYSWFEILYQKINTNIFRKQNALAKVYISAFIACCTLVFSEAVIIATKWELFLAFDFITATVFIFFLLIVLNNLKCNLIKIVLVFLGKYSFYLWILHGCFFGSFIKLQWVAFVIKLPVITSLILLIPIALIVAFVDRNIKVVLRL